MELSGQAKSELDVLFNAVTEIIDLCLKAFLENDLRSAYLVEPLEQVIDGLKETVRTNHIIRLQQGQCSIEAGFIWSDLLTNIERVSDHCSNIAGCIIDMSAGNLNLHESLKAFRNNAEEFSEQFKNYSIKYSLT